MYFPPLYSSGLMILMMQTTSTFHSPLKLINITVNEMQEKMKISELKYGRKSQVTFFRLSAQNTLAIKIKYIMVTDILQ